jgi:hypothetical protein
MTTESPRSVAALIVAGVGEAPMMAETLLSLAAQTSRDYQVVVAVTGAAEGDLAPFLSLVESFAAEFSDRVRVLGVPNECAASPLAMCARAVQSTYIALVHPEDVVFGHWIESIVANAATAGGRAIVPLTTTQLVERGTTSSGVVVTTVGRPQCAAPEHVGVLDLLVSPPVSVRGHALPRQVLADALPLGLPAGTEEWAAGLVTSLSCGFHHTGEVTYLRRVTVGSSAPPGGSVWERDRAAAIGLLDQHGLRLAPGFLASLRETQRNHVAMVQERGQVDERLAAATAAASLHAAAEMAAGRRVSELQSSASWKLSAPVRIPGRIARRLRRKS